MEQAEMTPPSSPLIGGFWETKLSWIVNQLAMPTDGVGYISDDDVGDKKGETISDVGKAKDKKGSQKETCKKKTYYWT